MIHETGNDQRRSRRRQMRYTAWVSLPEDVRHGCVLSDISDHGARLEVEDSKVIPDRFFLLLSGNGLARRACNVIWRKPTQIGVQFERKGAPIDTATLVPQIDADEAAPAKSSRLPKSVKPAVVRGR
jgi:hypothetical protein